MPDSIIAAAPHQDIQGEDPLNPSQDAVEFAQQVANTLGQKYGRVPQSIQDVADTTPIPRNESLASGRFLFDAPGTTGETVSIGAVTLSIPPQDIKVTNVSASDYIPALRSPTSTLVKSGRAQIRIDMTLVFPTLGLVNSELLPLIAQFRMTPILPLKSAYVARIVYPKVVNPTTTPDTLKRTDDIPAAIAQKYDENRKLVAQIGEKITTLRSLLPSIPDSDPKTPQRIAYESFDELIQALASVRVDTPNPGQIGPVEMGSSSIEAVTKAMGGIRNLLASVKSLINQQSLTEYFSNTLRDVFTVLIKMQENILAVQEFTSSPQGIGTIQDISTSTVPVVLNTMRVSTVESSVEGLLVTLSMTYFNYTPYTNFFEFKGASGEPVTDIVECPWFLTYIQRLLDKQTEGGGNDLDGFIFKPRESNLGSIKFTYPTPTLKRVENLSKDDFVSSDVTTSSTPVVRDSGISYTNVNKDLYIGSSDPNTIVAGVQVVLANRIAVQPIVGSVYPTAQYVGGMNASASVDVVLTADDADKHKELLDSVLRMKKDVDNVAILYGPKVRRSTRIAVVNDVLNLVGMAACQIDDMSVETIGPTSSRVTLRLTEYSVPQDKREQLKTKDKNIASQITTFLLWASKLVLPRVLDWKKVGYRPVFELLGVSKDVIKDKNLANSISTSLGVGTNGAQTNDFVSALAGILYRDALGVLALTVPAGSAPASEQALFASSTTYRSGLSRVKSAKSDSQKAALKAEFSTILSSLVKKLRSTPGDLTLLTNYRIYQTLYKELTGSFDYILNNGVNTELQTLQDNDPKSLLAEILSSYAVPGTDSSALIPRADQFFPTALPIKLLYGAVLASENEIGRLKNLATPSRSLSSVVVGYVRALYLAFIGVQDIPAEFGVSATALHTVGLPIQTVLEALEKGQDLRLAVPRLEIDPELLPTKDELQAAYNALVWAKSHSEELRLLLETSDNVFDAIGSAHPDLFLPTYGELYAPAFASKTVGVRTNVTTEAFRNRIVGADLNTLSDEDKEYVRRFVPTYADLGIRVPYGKKSSDFARTLDDEVEPGFFWYHQRTVASKNKAAANMEALKASSQGRTAPTVRDVDANGRITYNPVTYLPAVRQVVQNAGVLDINSASAMSALVEDALDNFKDDVFTMRRAYPTFKLYFIEKQFDSIRVADDLYGYNAVLGIKLHRHKFFPDTLEVDLINVTGNLDSDPNNIRGTIASNVRDITTDSGTQGMFDRSAVQAQIERFRDALKTLNTPSVTNPVTGKPVALQSLFLQEGTGVVLKMGYSNKPSELETVFTGQIAEIMRGDVLKLVCQSHAIQLTVPVNITEGTNPLETVAHIMSDEAPTDFGEKLLDIPENQRIKESRLGKFGDEKSFKDVVLTRRLDNIHLPSNSSKYKFKVPNMTGLEVLHEIARHFPGMVAAVRPYDTGSTVFMGFPSQPYRYTDDGLTEELEPFFRMHSSGRKSFRVPTYEDEFYSALTTELLLKFTAVPADGTPNNFFQTFFTVGFRDFLAAQFGSGFQLIGEDTERIFLLKLDATDQWRSLVNLVGEKVSRKIVELYFNFLGVVSHIHTSRGVALNFNTYIQSQRTVLKHRKLTDVESTAHTDFDGNGRAGTAFTEIPGSDEMILRLLGPLESYSHDKIRDNILRADQSFRSKDGLDIEDWKKYATIISRGTPSFKVFVQYLYYFLQGGFEGPELAKRIAEINAEEKAKESALPRGTRPFRTFHWVDSDHHIMRNDIRATTETMANAIQIRYPESEDIVERKDDQPVVVKSDVKWKILEVPFHRDLRDQDKKVRMLTELNATSQPRAEACALSNLARALSEMYRGELVIQGNERIAPYDVVFVYDWYNMLFGPIEVESVTHVLLSDTGFASIINPVAVVTAGYDIDMKQVLFQSVIHNKYLQDITTKQADFIIRADGSTTNKTGDKLFKEVQNNVTVLPITCDGRPWIAGLRGIEDKWFSLDLTGRWELADRGQAMVALSRLYYGGK